MGLKDEMGQQGSAEGEGLVVIDDRALSHIKDIARSLVHTEQVIVREKMLFLALYAYILRQGYRPGFEVRL